LDAGAEENSHTPARVQADDFHEWLYMRTAFSWRRVARRCRMEMVLLETLEREKEEEDDAKVAIKVVGQPGNDDGDATNGAAEGVSTASTVQTPVSVVGDSAEKTQGEVKVVTRPVSSTGARIAPPLFPGAKVTPLDAPVSSPAAITDYAHVDSICSLLCNKSQTLAPALVHEKAKEFDDYAFQVRCSISFAA
jgi:hypothetical protein